MLLAQQAGDLDEQYDNFRHELRSYGIRVLPEGDYRQGGAEFAAEFEQNAIQSAIFVQLLGTRPGLRPGDIPDGYQALQLELADRAGLEIMQWRAPNLVPDAIADERHQAIVFGPRVRAESFNAFKQAVKNLALEPPPESADNASDSKPFAFVNMHLDDRDFAATIATALASDGLTVQTPCFDASAKVNLPDLDAKLKRSDALIFVYHTASQTWLHQHHRRYTFISGKRPKGSQPRLIAVCLGPPTPRETGIFDRDLQTLDLTAGDLSALHEAVRGCGW